MEPLCVLTAAEQVAVWLRQALRRGEWGGAMPGGDSLAVELGVGRNTIEAALQLLEKEGLLVAQGVGRRRQIRLSPAQQVRPLRLAILDYEPVDLMSVGYGFELQRQLKAVGHDAFFTEKTLMELGMDARRVARFVSNCDADAWVVCSARRAVLEWFAAQSRPVFAMFGRREGLPLAAIGPDKLPAYQAAIRALVGLGHRRIVILERQVQREVGLGRIERGVLEEMAAHGIVVGPYNLPDWEDNVKGFHRLLRELYRITPPTALIIDEAFLFNAAQQHLAQRGILAPQHVSLICTDNDHTFSWCQPTIAHIRWDIQSVVQRIVRWASNISRGVDDRRQSFTAAEFVTGGTVGPVPRRDKVVRANLRS